MRLKTKVFLLVMALAVPFGAVFFALLVSVLVQQFRSIEEELARKAVFRADAMVATELADMQRFAALYVSTTPNPVPSPDELRHANLNLAIVLDRAGRTTHIVAVDAAGTPTDSAAFTPTTASREPGAFFFSFDPARPIRGLCLTPSGPLQYVSVARVRADTPTEIHGSLVLARLFEPRGYDDDDGTIFDRIDVISAADAVASGMPASALEFPDETTVWSEPLLIAAGRPIADATGRQTIVVRVLRSRQLYSNAVAATAAVIAAVVAGGLSLTLAFVGALRILVLRRISRLARFAERERHEGLLLRRIEDDSPDEIGQLVRAFNTMLDRLADRTDLLRQRNRDLIGALQIKDDFVQNASHELRTPLATIIGFADRLRREFPPVEPPPPSTSADTSTAAAVAVREIGRAAAHLSGLIDELLELGRARAGKLEFRLGPVDVQEVIADVVPLVAVQAEAKGIAVVVADADEIPAVWADHRRLCQVVLNLIANAVKFSPPGEVRIAVTVEPKPESEPATVRIAVSDPGPGIPAEHLTHIFEPFFQLPPPSAPAHAPNTSLGGGSGAGGSGLGLAISREFVDRMGGEIGVESTLGHGSTFFVRLHTAAPTAAPTN